MPNDKDYLTPEEAGELLGLNPYWIRQRCRAGTLPGIKLGRGEKAPWRIPYDDLMTWLDEGKNDAYESNPPDG